MLTVENIVDTLAKGKKKYRKRGLNKIKQIVIHHFGSFSSIRSVARYHVRGRGWPGIGYHFVIDANGLAYMVNTIDTVSYHCKNQNTKSIGICFIGNFEEFSPSDDQLLALDQLINSIHNVLGHIPVIGHRDARATLCPGRNLYEKIEGKYKGF